VRCWGTGGYYIGYANDEWIGDDEDPKVAGDVDVGGTVVQISASWYHTCVLLDTGKVRCWGSGASGELGYANTNDIGDDEAPATAGEVDVGGTVTQISAGPHHTCACLDDGTVRCWGSNQYWPLGYPSSDSIGDNESPAAASPVDVGGFAVQVTTSFGHTCALLDSGKVRCWGDGNSGRLGYGNQNTIGDDETPASAGDVDLGGNAVQIVSGWFFTCALLDTGKVRCWGSGVQNGGGSVGVGYGNLDVIGDNETPASAGDIDVGGAVSELAAGDFAVCAVLTTGKVRCWGSGEQGELGYGNTDNIGDDETPASAGDVDVGGLVSRVDMGFLHTCAVLESGTVRCWGRGSTGALGYGNTSDIGDDETPASAGDVATH
jgi:alpha-tubulin suppressor-like RCC1 family protein